MKEGKEEKKRRVKEEYAGWLGRKNVPSPSELQPASATRKTAGWPGLEFFSSDLEDSI